MSLFSELVTLFASVFQPKPVYTTIIYPSQGMNHPGFRGGRFV